MTFRDLRALPLAAATLAAASVALGLWARFKNLGSAPLAVDEYYLLEAARNILRAGVPAFGCGGYYVRGLLHQYLTAAFLLPGWISAETAIRLPSALASVITLWGGYRLARKLGGFAAALLVLVILSLSLWEVEFARFGRMYAILQACTVFYAYFSVDFFETGNQRSLWAMIGIGVIAALSHEAGILLSSFCILAVIIQPSTVRIVPALASFAAFAIGALQFVINFRRLGIDAAKTEEVLGSTVEALPDNGFAALPNLIPAPAYFRFLVIAIALLGTWFVLRGRPDQPTRALDRRRLIEIGAWLAVFLALAFQQFLLGALLLACAVGLEMTEVGKLKRRDVALPALACAAVIGVAWLACAAFSPAQGGARTAVFELARSALRYPDLYWKVFQAWARVLPVLGLAVGVVIAGAGVLAVWSDSSVATRRYRLLLGFTLVLLIAVGLTFQPASSTRYTYFIYPLLIVLFVQGALMLSGRFLSADSAVALPVGAALLLFFLSNDFGWRHLLFVDRPEYIFRTAYSINLSEHFYRHWDYRSIGRVLDERASPGDLVISTTYAVIPFYSRSLQYVYLNDRRIWNVSGCDGTRDLWSNLPLIFDPARLEEMVTSSSRPVWLVVPTERYWARTPVEAELLSRYRDHEVFRTVDGYLALIHITAAAAVR